MTIKSGRWLVYFVLFFWPVFAVFEGVQLIRKHYGNKSANTFSQEVVKLSKESKKWWWIKTLFPFWVIITGIWLVPHLGVIRL